MRTSNAFVLQGKPPPNTDCDFSLSDWWISPPAEFYCAAIKQDAYALEWSTGLKIRSTNIILIFYFGLVRGCIDADLCK